MKILNKVYMSKEGAMETDPTRAFAWELSETSSKGVNNYPLLTFSAALDILNNLSKFEAIIAEYKEELTKNAS